MAEGGPNPHEETASAVRVEESDIFARDGRRLAVSCFRPAEAPRFGVVINSATGVPRQYYRRFASWLAEQDVLVLTFDYRGLHGSRDRPIRQDRAKVSEWGALDVAAAIDALADELGERPTFAIGHSIGGQLIGLAPNNHRLFGAVGLATQSGYWGHWPLKGRAHWIWRWYVEQPALACLLGYYPGRRYYGTDLPEGVATEFARWCRSRDYIVDALGRPLREHFEAFGRPYRFIGFADDPVAPLSAVQALIGMYANAGSALEWLVPEELGAPAVGHFGFFRESGRSMWPRMLTWLEAVGAPAGRRRR